MCHDYLVRQNVLAYVMDSFGRSKADINFGPKITRPHLSQRRRNVIPRSLEMFYLKEHHQLHQIALKTAQTTTQPKDIDSHNMQAEWFQG